MIKPINVVKGVSLKWFLFGYVLATILTAGILDGRFSAMSKAFMNPVAVNSAHFVTEVSAK